MVACSVNGADRRSVSPPTAGRPGGPISAGKGPAGTSPSGGGTACTTASVVASWTVARRAAALVVVPVTGYDLAAVEPLLAEGVGGLLLLGPTTAPADLAERLRVALRRSPGGEHPLVMADEEGGGVQRLTGVVASQPWARQQAATMTPAQVEASAATVGAQMHALGVSVDLAPVLDVDGGDGPSATDPDGLRSFADNPGTVARYGVADLRGLEAGGVLPVVKHFPGLGDATANTDYGTADTQPLAQLRSDGLLPFEAAVQAGAPAVMVTNADVPGLSPDLPASLSSAVIDGLLRKGLHFGGLILTDSLSAGAIAQAGYPVPVAAARAVAAGADMVLFGSTLTPVQTELLGARQVQATTAQVVAALSAADASGALPVARLDQAVDHVMTAEHADLCPAGSAGAR